MYWQKKKSNFEFSGAIILCFEHTQTTYMESGFMGGGRKMVVPENIPTKISSYVQQVVHLYRLFNEPQ
jgi:hypothetical protein